MQTTKEDQLMSRSQNIYPPCDTDHQDDRITTEHVSSCDKGCHTQQLVTYIFSTITVLAMIPAHP